MPPPQTPDETERLAEELGGLSAALARSRDAARRADRRLSLALQAFESMVWELSFTERRLFITGAVAAIYNPPPTFQALADDLLFACHPLDRPRVEALWRAHLEDGRPFRTEYRISRCDDREVWVEAAAEMLRDQAGAPERAIGVVKDITVKKLDQIAMAHARQAAEAANRAKSEFLANMGHEICTPLNCVLGVAGALSRTELEPQQQEMVKLIESSAQTLERLLGDVLDIGRIDSGRLKLDQAPGVVSRRAVDGPSAQGGLVGPNGQPPRILLAEDHPTNRKVAEMILGAAGARLVHVENGAEAVSAAETQDFDLILMDMQMPVMDGLTAIRAIRARERDQGLARTPILTLTANAMAEHARASQEAGADGHVTKPVSAKTLLDDVARAISGQVVQKTATA